MAILAPSLFVDEMGGNGMKWAPLPGFVFMKNGSVLHMCSVAIDVWSQSSVSKEMFAYILCPNFDGQWEDSQRNETKQEDRVVNVRFEGTSVSTSKAHQLLCCRANGLSAMFHECL